MVSSVLVFVKRWGIRVLRALFSLMLIVFLGRTANAVTSLNNVVYGKVCFEIRNKVSFDMHIYIIHPYFSPIPLGDHFCCKEREFKKIAH